MPMLRCAPATGTERTGGRMSWSYSCTVWCDEDGCHTWYQGEEGLRRGEVWKVAYARGWRRTGQGKVLCPRSVAGTSVLIKGRGYE